MYRKILLINPFGIGDVLFTTPIIHTLKDAIPEAKVGYLCNRRTAPILENNPYIDSLFIYERDEFEAVRKKSSLSWLKKIIVFLNQIKKEHFDMALDFSLNKQYGFFSWYAGIRERIGYDFNNRGCFLNRKIKLSGYEGRHIVDYYAELLKYLGLDLKYRNLEIYLKEDDKIWAEEIFKNEGIDNSRLLIALIPGAGRSWGRDSYLKHWPAENFGRLADKIIEKYKATIIILGDFSEEAIAKRVIENMRYKTIDLSGITTIGQLTAILNKTGLVITNDGGPLHIAVALGKKTVSFFGPVNPEVYGPYPADTKRHIVLTKDLDCRPCYRNFRLSPCLRDRQCLKGLDVEEAVEAVSKLLKEED